MNTGMATVAILVVLLVALTSTMLLGYLIYERTLSGLVTSRFEFIAKELKVKVEAGIDLGLPLGQLENIDELLLQHMASDESVAGISIVHVAGTILFDTDRERIGEPYHSEWINQITHDSLELGKVHVGEFEIGLPLSTSYGKTVGVLLVRYSAEFYDNKRMTVAKHLLFSMFGVFVVAGALGIAGVLLIIRPLRRAVVQLAAGLGGLREHVASVAPDSGARLGDAVDGEIIQALLSLNLNDDKAAPPSAGDRSSPENG